ncbi:RagB/SusD family nutrient uptake outer membrane protein [Desertivirga arenae]|uniref:RagB/SusD family nutrient uptake outer membrane protein n=1 Tax=Desertivirga arenae TaxID=2810309 RepID=UPI001A97986F|nr:RagB/SusD family nutrient uptake outer membrane protein [Pedobacter sp. SYSU D00823]
MKTIYKAVLMLLLLTGSIGCESELSAPPKNAKVEGNTILDQATSQIALNGAYYNFANATATRANWQQHQLLPATLAGYLGYGLGTGKLEENRNETAASYYWDESYKAINAANGVISGVELLPDNKFTGSKKKEILAEAKFIRAYSHFKLLSFYGEWFNQNSTKGVLLRDKLSTLENVQKKRSTVKESYDFILSDLDEAISNAPDINPNHYATKWAAMALKMRVLINRGSASDYETVIALADQIIDSGKYQLETNYQDIFRKNGLASKEVILGIKPQASQASDNYSKSRQYWPGASALYVAKKALKDLYFGDPRGSWIIGSPNPYSTYSPNTNYFTKYQQEGLSASVLSETDYAIRLSEVYLLKAEAIVRSGGSLTSARSLLHLVQSKSGIMATTNNIPYLAAEAADTADKLLMELYKETAKNLVAEDGSEWMALLRLPFNLLRQLRPTITSQNQFILPVPVTEFINNPAFGEQNSGYSAN